MRARKYLLLALAILLPASASAAGTVVKNKMEWNGLVRYYAVYVPQGLPANAPMVLFLHATQIGNPSSPPWLSLRPEWESVADANNFLMVWPVSTYNTRASQWYWDCDFFDFSFPVYPDDVGFLRSLISTLSAQYHSNPKQIFVTGMSSGGYMTHRVGIKLSDIVAAIAPVSGAVWIQPASLDQAPPPPVQPISVIEFHGTQDQQVPYCGGTNRLAWKEPDNTIASTQESVNYWVASNGCTQLSTTQTICTSNGGPNKNFKGLDATGCANNVDVQFVPEEGYGHIWVAGTETLIWNFFSTHGR